MMPAIQLMKEAEALGATFRLDDGEVKIVAPAPLPELLMSKLREHKPEIVEHLRRSYECRYADDRLGDDELAEIVRCVESEGYVLLWSDIVDDLIGVYDTDTDQYKIPSVFVAYSNAELQQLFRDDVDDPSSAVLKLIHAAKRTGATLTAAYADLDVGQALKRLRRGFDWLTVRHKLFDRDSRERSGDQKFTKAIDAWDRLEATLRSFYGLKGCIWGDQKHCEEAAPIRCQECAAVGGLESSD